MFPFHHISHLVCLRMRIRCLRKRISPWQDDTYHPIQPWSPACHVHGMRLDASYDKSILSRTTTHTNTYDLNGKSSVPASPQRLCTMHNPHHVYGYTAIPFAYSFIKSVTTDFLLSRPLLGRKRFLCRKHWYHKKINITFDGDAHYLSNFPKDGRFCPFSEAAISS